MILVQFGFNDLRFVRGCNYLVCNLRALSYWVIETRFIPEFIFVVFSTLSLFIILIIWWVRWIQQRRIWQTWVWIWVNWYVRYRIGWIFAWLSIYFSCHAFLWWAMWWWRGVTCSPYKNICGAGTVECTSNANIFSIAQISDESWIDPMFFESDGMVWFELVWFVSMWIGSEYFWLKFGIESVWFQFAECFLPTFSTLK